MKSALIERLEAQANDSEPLLSATAASSVYSLYNLGKESGQKVEFQPSCLMLKMVNYISSLPLHVSGNVHACHTEVHCIPFSQVGFSHVTGLHC